MLRVMVLSFFIKRYIRKHDRFLIYIHLFEMSLKIPLKVTVLDNKTNFRFKYNNKSVPSKMGKLIGLLKSEGYQSMTDNQANDYFTTKGES